MEESANALAFLSVEFSLLNDKKLRVDRKDFEKLCSNSVLLKYLIFGHEGFAANPLDIHEGVLRVDLIPYNVEHEAFAALVGRVLSDMHVRKHEMEMTDVATALGFHDYNERQAVIYAERKEKQEQESKKEYEAKIAKAKLPSLIPATDVDRVFLWAFSYDPDDKALRAENFTCIRSENTGNTNRIVCVYRKPNPAYNADGSDPRASEPACAALGLPEL